MKEQGYAELILRFLRTVLLIDAILAGAVGLIGSFLDLRTAEAYGSAMIRIGMIVLFIAVLTGAGGLSARATDIGAYTLSGAGNRFDNMMQMAESRRSSLGCLFTLLIAALGLVATGYLLPVIASLFR